MFAFQLVPRVPPNTKVFPSYQCQFSVCAHAYAACETGPMQAHMYAQSDAEQLKSGGGLVRTWPRFCGAALTRKITFPAH
jgi:hypothetical protein